MDQSIQQTLFNIDLARVEALQTSFAAKYGVQFFAELDSNVYPYEGMLSQTVRVHGLQRRSQVDTDILLDEKVSQLSDNRDYGVMTDCTPKQLMAIEELSRPSKRTNVCKYCMGKAS